MKRRGFLGALIAVVAAPSVPALALDGSALSGGMAREAIEWARALDFPGCLLVRAAWQHNGRRAYSLAHVPEDLWHGSLEYRRLIEKDLQCSVRAYFKKRAAEGWA